MVCADKIDSLLQRIDNLVKSLKFVLQIGRNAYCINNVLGIGVLLRVFSSFLKNGFSNHESWQQLYCPASSSAVTN